MTRFLHTSDWQIGKPFAGIADPDRRAAARAARIAGIARIAEHARTRRVEFVLVAGDLFDSPRPDGQTLLATLAALGAFPCPVFAIPGNHDHGGPASVWNREPFARARAERAPNFQVLLAAGPCVTANAVLLPCPLERRQTLQDPLGWLRDAAAVEARLPHAARALPRIVLAHGSTQEFATRDEDDSVVQTNLLDLATLPDGLADYVALGDWHAPKRVGERAWYSGTHEPDRFPKGEDYDAGHVLEVEIASRGALPQVTRLVTKELGWHEFTARLDGEGGIAELSTALQRTLAGRVAKDLVALTLHGSVGLEARAALDALLATTADQVLRLECRDELVLLPSDAELARIATPEDPQLTAVTARLREGLARGGTEGEVARLALRELHALLATGS